MCAWNDTLFPDNWREQVRDYLAPFETKWRHPDDEQPFGLGYYHLEALEWTQTQGKGEWGTFFFGHARLHYLSPPGWEGEQSVAVIWSAKADFDSPLHFWAGAALLSRLKYSGDEWFDFRQHPPCVLADLTALTTWATEEPFYQWPPNWRPLPPVMREKFLRGWYLGSDDAYAETLLCETGKSYFLWEWGTAA